MDSTLSLHHSVVVHIHSCSRALHPAWKQAHVIREAIGEDHDEVNQHPDAKASKSEQLKNAADHAPVVETMHTKLAQKHAQKRCGGPASISSHHGWMVERAIILIREIAGDNHDQI